MTRAALAAAVVLLACSLALADPEREADAAFRDAMARADIAALEALGAQRPITRWTDDAWLEAARLAARANDFPRAKAALDQALAVSSDAQLVRRARTELARIAGMAGATGEFREVATAHEELVPKLHAGGDPRPTLERLEALVRAHPAYPRRVPLMIAIASGWEREGEAERAIKWLRDALTAALSPTDRLRAQAELIRTLIRSGELDAAETELAAFREAAPGLRASLQRQLDRAQVRRMIRIAMWSVLVVLTTLAALSLRRSSKSWGAVARNLVRPPIEVLFIAPVAAILVAVAYTGNPLVARAVLLIAVGGVVTTWVSSTLLAAHRPRGNRFALHVALVLIAIGATTYLAVDRGQLIDFVLETWRAGHER